MTRLIAALAFVCCVAVAFGGPQKHRRHDATYIYDPSDWRWDRRQLDRPADFVGGYDAFVRRLSYPAALRLRRVEGRGAARVAVDSTGRIRSISFEPRLPRELEQIVVSAVRRSQFTPARRKGKAIDSYLRIPVTFVAP